MWGPCWTSCSRRATPTRASGATQARSRTCSCPTPRRPWRTNVNALTIGEHADDTYESLQPLDAKVRVRALIDAHGKSIRAYAEAKFAGLARHKDGTYSKITVSGSFFLVPAGDGWKIEAFRVNRLERPAKAPASPSSSASASGGSS